MRKWTLYGVVMGLALLVLGVLLVPAAAQGTLPNGSLPPQRAGRVLLVDDDWDFIFQHPDSQGGRPFYTSTLEALGVSCDVWDIQTLGQPADADLAGYEAVIWFTGYADDWFKPKDLGVFTPDNEAVVGRYLDNSGKFLLSSSQYFWWTEFDITLFMQNYLGITWMDGWVEDRTLVGIGGNPIGNGLGPYTMVRPDAYGVYWPEGVYEGPAPYEAWATDATEPFRYDVPANTNPNSTNYDGGNFRTVYLAWPFEWIGTPDERVQVLGGILDWLGVGRGISPRAYLPLVGRSWSK